jgi:hypothetical protein
MLGYSNGAAGAYLSPMQIARMHQWLTTDYTSYLECVNDSISLTIEDGVDTTWTSAVYVVRTKWTQRAFI